MAAGWALSATRHGRVPAEAGAHGRLERLLTTFKVGWGSAGRRRPRRTTATAGLTWAQLSSGPGDHRGGAGDDARGSCQRPAAQRNSPLRLRREFEPRRKSRRAVIAPRGPRRETGIKFAGYLEQQRKSIEKLKAAEAVAIPDWIDYRAISRPLARDARSHGAGTPGHYGQAAAFPASRPPRSAWSMSPFSTGSPAASKLIRQHPWVPHLAGLCCCRLGGEI